MLFQWIGDLIDVDGEICWLMEKIIYNSLFDSIDEDPGISDEIYILTVMCMLLFQFVVHIMYLRVYHIYSL